MTLPTQMAHALDSQFYGSLRLQTEYIQADNQKTTFDGKKFDPAGSGGRSLNFGIQYDF